MSGLTGAEFWATHCRWCAHERHDLRDDVRCDVIVGGYGSPTPEPQHCECLQWSDVLAMVARREAAAIASVLTVDRVAAALHSRCMEEYAHARKVDPTRLLTMHMADAHHDAAARVVAALTGGQG